MIRSHAQLSSPVRKKRRRFEHHYDRDLLNTAVQQVKNGELGINEASDKYNIPRTTISSRLRKDGWYSKDTILPDPELSPRIKNELLVWLKTMRQISCSTVLTALPFVMQEVCEMSGEHTLFAASNLPPVGYCRRFLDEIRIQKEKELKNSEGTLVWKSNSCSVIDLWLKNLGELFEIQYGLDADSFLSGSEVNARQIYCCHRLAMVLKREDGGTGKLVHCQPPHQKHLPSIITMFTCVGVDGSALTPLFVAKSRSSEQKYFAKSKTSFPSFEVWSKECVMDADVFLDWLQLIVRELGDDETNRPLLLFLDQSIGIISLAVLDFCRDNMIILFYLPDTTAGSRLPFGSAIFDELIKSSPEFSGRSKRSITKAHSLQVLPKLWSCLQKEVIIAEFRRVGLVPLDKKVLECCMTPVSGVNNHLTRNNPGDAVNGSMDSSSPRLEISFVTSESEVLSSVPEPISKNVNMRSTCKKSSMSSTPHVPLAYSKSCLESAQNIPCESAQDSSMPQPNEQDKLLPGTNKRKRKQPLANSASPRLPKKTKKTTSAVVSSTQVNHEADKSPAINSDVGQAVKSRKKSAATNMAAVKMEPSDVEMPTRNSADTGSPSEPAVKPKQKRKKVRSPPEALVETVEECKVEDSQVALMEGTETKQSEGGSSITAKFRIVVDNSKRKKKDKVIKERKRKGNRKESSRKELGKPAKSRKETVTEAPSSNHSLVNAFSDRISKIKDEFPSSIIGNSVDVVAPPALGALDPEARTSEDPANFNAIAPRAKSLDASCLHCEDSKEDRVAGIRLGLTRALNIIEMTIPKDLLQVYVKRFNRLRECRMNECYEPVRSNVFGQMHGHQKQKTDPILSDPSFIIWSELRRSLDLCSVFPSQETKAAAESIENMYREEGDSEACRYQTLSRSRSENTGADYSAHCCDMNKIGRSVSEGAGSLGNAKCRFKETPNRVRRDLCFRKRLSEKLDSLHMNQEGALENDQLHPSTSTPLTPKNSDPDAYRFRSCRLEDPSGRRSASACEIMDRSGPVQPCEAVAGASRLSVSENNDCQTRIKLESFNTAFSFLQAGNALSESGIRDNFKNFSSADINNNKNDAMFMNNFTHFNATVCGCCNGNVGLARDVSSVPGSLISCTNMTNNVQYFSALANDKLAIAGTRDSTRDRSISSNLLAHDDGSYSSYPVGMDSAGFGGPVGDVYSSNFRFCDSGISLGSGDQTPRVTELSSFVSASDMSQRTNCGSSDVFYSAAQLTNSEHITSHCPSVNPTIAPASASCAKFTPIYGSIVNHNMPTWGRDLTVSAAHKMHGGFIVNCGRTSNLMETQALQEPYLDINSQILPSDFTSSLSQNNQDIFRQTDNSCLGQNHDLALNAFVSTANFRPTSFTECLPDTSTCTGHTEENTSGTGLSCVSVDRQLDHIKEDVSSQSTTAYSQNSCSNLPYNSGGSLMTVGCHPHLPVDKRHFNGSVSSICDVAGSQNCTFGLQSNGYDYQSHSLNNGPVMQSSCSSRHSDCSCPDKNYSGLSNGLTCDHSCTAPGNKVSGSPNPHSTPINHITPSKTVFQQPGTQAGEKNLPILNSDIGVVDANGAASQCFNTTTSKQIKPTLLASRKPSCLKLVGKLNPSLHPQKSLTCVSGRKKLSSILPSAVDSSGDLSDLVIDESKDEASCDTENQSHEADDYVEITCNVSVKVEPENGLNGPQKKYRKLEAGNDRRSAGDKNDHFDDRSQKMEADNRAEEASNGANDNLFIACDAKAVDSVAQHSEKIRQIDEVKSEFSSPDDVTHALNTDRSFSSTPYHLDVSSPYYDPLGSIDISSEMLDMDHFDDSSPIRMILPHSSSLGEAKCGAPHSSFGSVGEEQAGDRSLNLQLSGMSRSNDSHSDSDIDSNHRDQTSRTLHPESVSGIPASDTSRPNAGGSDSDLVSDSDNLRSETVAGESPSRAADDNELEDSFLACDENLGSWSSDDEED